ncbi:hypothetical protein O6H91_02G156200 [Diphasiastrum complanatum]|uniref:Uncharacterized protein n=1 Tax=Diphasiastrum complanatum TaxID=34168 RepID=A0ACC2EMC3_DIPCM|nr:hypothetical protein O6H91_02G156200 [Diphasiastrum complanatum]
MGRQPGSEAAASSSFLRLPSNKPNYKALKAEAKANNILSRLRPIAPKPQAPKHNVADYSLTTCYADARNRNSKLCWPKDDEKSKISRKRSSDAIFISSKGSTKLCRASYKCDAVGEYNGNSAYQPNTQRKLCQAGRIARALKPSSGQLAKDVMNSAAQGLSVTIINERRSISKRSGTASETQGRCYVAEFQKHLPFLPLHCSAEINSTPLSTNFNSDWNVKTIDSIDTASAKYSNKDDSFPLQLLPSRWSTVENETSNTISWDRDLVTLPLFPDTPLQYCSPYRSQKNDSCWQNVMEGNSNG